MSRPPAALHAQLGWTRANALGLGRGGGDGAARPVLRVRAARRARRHEGPWDARQLPIYVDGKLVGDRDVAYTTPFAFNPGALTCGAAPGSPVTEDYKAPFRFSGTLHTVTVDLSGELIREPEAELKLHMARQ